MEWLEDCLFPNGPLLFCGPLKIMIKFILNPLCPKRSNFHLFVY